jgi:TonB family protein
VIHFDFDHRYQDELVVGSAISRREGVIWSVVAHVVILAFLLYLPQTMLFELTPEEIEEQRLERLAEVEPEEDAPMFVFVEPQLDMPAEAVRERADLSDLDRRSQTPERAPTPTNPLPFSLGDTSERVEAAAPAEPQIQRGAEAPPAPEPPPPAPPPQEQIARNMPPPLEQPRPSRPQPPAPRAPPGSILGEAIRNIDKYAQNQTFNNPQGGDTDPGAAIQFDTKGVEFGPWLRRFVSQVRRNWFVPLSAMTFRGHVVLQFNIHRDGRITDVQIAKPSDIESFNRAAYNAIVGSNPTEPLPPEYPDDKAFFTVTFYYNEQPGS